MERTTKPAAAWIGGIALLIVVGGTGNAYAATTLGFEPVAAGLAGDGSSGDS
jgi:hypothetical protein